MAGVKNAFPAFADSHETKKRVREIQILINVIEPDPYFQPAFLSDESRLWQCTRHEDDVVHARLRAYFGPKIELQFDATLIELVDSIKRQIPNWPGDD